ncbi:Fc.00g024320.m01.CDS01 [Cosmosporella sp. VM-42]
MGHITLTDGLAIWELIFYVPALVGGIWVCTRHGFAKASGWIFLAIFSAIRIVSCSAQIATIASTSDTPITIATITGFLGLSPLLLAALGILARVYYTILEMPWSTVFSLVVLKAVQTPAAVALILCIVGAVSADTPADIANEGTVKAGVILFLIVLILLGLLAAGAAVVRHMTQRRGEGKLLAAVVTSLPFLLIRLIHSLLLIFSSSFQASAAKSSTSSVLTELFMAKIEEMIVVSLFLWAGITHTAVPKNGDGTKRSKKEMLAYRAGRGDFGRGKFGLVSMAISAAVSMLQKKDDEEDEPRA